MGKQIINNDLKNMKMGQALKMLGELFKEVDLNDKNTVWFNDLMEVMRRENENFEEILRDSIKWNIIEKKVTSAQKDLLINELVKKL